MSVTPGRTPISRLQKVLGDNLVGVCLHGSAVLGDFSLDQSDIDVVAVAERYLSEEQKRSIAEQLSSASLASTGS